VTPVLAIVTATPQVSVAIGEPGGPVVASLRLAQGRRHGEVLAPAIESLTRLAGVGLDDVSMVAVDAGPGLFTGLRVGVATAKALASALCVPLVAASSLDLLAQPHRDTGLDVASVVDARRGEVFWALYRSSEEGMLAVSEASVATPERLAAALGPDVLLTGDGARRYESLLAGFRIAREQFDHPSADALVQMAAARPAVAPEKVTPIYIRGADVRIGWEQRDDRVRNVRDDRVRNVRDDEVRNVSHG
jgi:tRNA threonylcarbamoyladenosine biosynthesis protein TsaB